MSSKTKKVLVGLGKVACPGSDSRKMRDVNSSCLKRKPHLGVPSPPRAFQGANNGKIGMQTEGEE